MAVIHQGIIKVNDGSAKPQIMRLQLRPETLVFQKEEVVYASTPTPLDAKERHVRISRKKTDTLGISVKGGAEHRLPILISRIFEDQAADLTRQLYVGDAIIKVNNVDIEKCLHDDAVKILKSAGREVLLTVRHHLAATPFLAHSLQKSLSSEDNTNHGLGKPLPCSSRALPKLERRWDDVVTVPLLMAFVTRYISGTDKLRPYAFEIRNHDQTFISVIECEDEESSVDEWVKLISQTISDLNQIQVKVLNQVLPPGKTLSFMAWVEEAKLQKRKSWCNWFPCFIALYGSDVCLYEKPPVSLKDWIKSECSFKIYQTMLKSLKDEDCLDGRTNCFLLQTCDGTSHYISVENQTVLEQLETAWQRATYSAVTKLGSKTFPAMVRGKIAALTLDWNMGFALYDTEAKKYGWKFRFSQLKGSSDDGKSRLKLHFQDPITKEIETKELETPSLQNLLLCIHSFLTAKVVSVDPSFLQDNT